MIEALLVASPSPVDKAVLDGLAGHDVERHLASLDVFWRGRGMRVDRTQGKVSLVPSEDVVKSLAARHTAKRRKLTHAAVEALCYVAIHQPVTAKDIERARGLSMFKGVLESLLDSGYVRTALRKTDSGRAITYVTTDAFLDHFNLSSLSDLPSRSELADMAIPPEEDDPEDAQIENETPQPHLLTAFGLETSNLSPMSDET